MNKRPIYLFFVFCMLLAVFPVMTLADDKSVFDATGLENAAREHKATEISSVKSIVSFQEISGQYSRIVFSVEDKPTLEQIAEFLPQTLTAYLTGGESVVIPVTWFCVGGDYEETAYYYYQFSPRWDGTLYALDGNLDPLLDVPYVSLFLKNEDWASLMAVTSSPNETVVFNYLTREMGLNSAAACGIMANIQAESYFNPNALGDNGTSYGICQWHNERWDRMRNYCVQNGYDSTTLNGQLHYLEYELKNYYASVLNSIRNVSNNADGAYSAASTWCVRFEIPANKESVAIVRGNLAKNTYWSEYKDVAGLNGTESYYWPVPSGTETSRQYTSEHQAIDITASGGNIIATKSGVVQRVYTGCGNNSGLASGGRSCSSATCSCQNLWSYSGKQFCNWGYGNGVIIRHSDGSGYSMYAHMASVTVSEGQTIRQGAMIGTMGSTGSSTGRHLHFQLSKSITTRGTYDEPANTIDNSKNVLAYVYPPYSGSGGGSDSNTISVTWSLNSNRHWVGETNAVVSAILRVNGTSINNVVEVGVDIYDASHTKVAYHGNQFLIISI